MIMRRRSVCRKHVFDTGGAGKALWQTERPMVKKSGGSIEFHSFMISYKNNTRTHALIYHSLPHGTWPGKTRTKFEVHSKNVFLVNPFPKTYYSATSP